MELSQQCRDQVSSRRDCGCVWMPAGSAWLEPPPPRLRIAAWLPPPRTALFNRTSGGRGTADRSGHGDQGTADRFIAVCTSEVQHLYS